MKAVPNIRPAVEKDIQSITEIYNHAIIHTTATFDTETKTLENRLEWFRQHSPTHSIIVAEYEGEIAGWASLSKWSDKMAYDSSVENSLYVAEKYRGKGFGKKMLERLIEEGRKNGFHTIIARISDGNDISLKMHYDLGFENTGTLKEVGIKFGKLIDVHLLQIYL